MKLLALFLAIPLLASCFDVQEPLKSTRDDKTFTMTIELVDLSEVTEICSKLGVPYDANGCAAFDLDTKHCTVYVPPLRHAADSERMEILGHEAWHCRFGKWHD